MSASERIAVGKATPRTHAFLALAAAVTAWGIGWPVNRAILYHLAPLSAVAVRSAIAAVALFAIAAAQRRLTVPNRNDLPVLLSICLLHMVGYAVLVSVGLLFVPVGRSVVLAYTTPLWVTPGAALFLGERLTMRRATGAALGLTGLAVMFNPLAFVWRAAFTVSRPIPLLAPLIRTVATGLMLLNGLRPPSCVMMQATASCHHGSNAPAGAPKFRSQRRGS